MSTIRLIRWPSLARLVAAGVLALLLALSLPRLLRAPEPPPVPADVGLPRASALTVMPAHAKRPEQVQPKPREAKPKPERKPPAPKPPPKPKPKPEPQAPPQPVRSPEPATAVAYSPPAVPAAPPAPPPSPSPPPASSGSPPPEFGFEH